MKYIVGVVVGGAVVAAAGYATITVVAHLVENALIAVGDDR